MRVGPQADGAKNASREQAIRVKYIKGGGKFTSKEWGDAVAFDAETKNLF